MHGPETGILAEIVIIFGLAVVVMLLFDRLRVPSVLGLIATGALVGPEGLGIVAAGGQVESLAEIGVVLLLFTIGMEFSFQQLLKIRATVLIAGPIQVGLSILAALGLAMMAGFSVNEGVFFGFLVSMSSTAIVLKVLQQRAEMNKQHGRTSLGILIFQDIVVVPMMLMLPLLVVEPGVGHYGGGNLYQLTIGLVIVTLVLTASQFIVPRLLYQISRTKSRELFLLTVLVICLSVAWITSMAGLSLALGAFLAGLTISRSEYSHHALGSVLPFRDVFTAFFFVSVGMLFDWRLVAEFPLLIAGLVVGVMVAKTLITAIASLAIGQSLRVALTSGIALGQVGEFSFILAQAGMAVGLFSGDQYQKALAVIILTMAATPYCIASADRIASFVDRCPLPRWLRTGWKPTQMALDHDVDDHVVIVGFGLNGRNLARSARAAQVPYVVIEFNPETVRREQESGEPIIFGDASHDAVLESAGIHRARVVAVLIDDPAATRRIIEAARRLRPTAYVIARTRYLLEMQPLLDNGANDVIPEEFETSVEVFTRVLRQYLVPRNDIDKFVTEIRSDHYQVLRDQPENRPGIFANQPGISLSNLEMDWLLVAPDSPLVGQTLAEARIRQDHHLTVLFIRRGKTDIPTPQADTKLQAGDIVFVLGKPDDICDKMGLFAGAEYEQSRAAATKTE